MRTMGYYALHYRHWLESFPPEQILTLVFERDIRDPAMRPRTVARIFAHLGVPCLEKIEFDEARNARASFLAMQAARFVPPRSFAGKALRHALGLLVPAALDRRFKPLVTPEDKARLREHYRPHVAETSALLGVELEQYWR